MKRLLYIILIFLFFINICSKTFASDSSSIDIELLKQQGVNYYQNGYYEDALSYFLKIPYSKRDETVYILIANSYESIGKTHHAVDTLNRLIQTSRTMPISHKAYYNLGNLYLKNDRHEEAIKAYNNTIILNKNFAPAYYNTGWCLYQLGNYKQSIKYYKKAIKINSKKAYYYFNTALSYNAMNKNKSAKKYFKLYSDYKK